MPYSYPLAVDLKMPLIFSWTDAFLGLVARRVWQPVRARLVRWCGAGGVELLEEVVGDGVLHLHNANFAGHGAGVPDGDGGDADGGRSRSGSSSGDSSSSSTGSSTSAASTVVAGGEAGGEVAVAVPKATAPVWAAAAAAVTAPAAAAVTTVRPAL